MNTQIEVRRDIARLAATAELFFGIQFPDTDHAFLGELLDQWSARAILAGIEILVATNPDRELLPLVREKIARVLGFLAQGAVLDETLADSWRPYDSTGRLPVGPTLAALRQLNHNNFAAFTSGAAN